VTISKFVPDEMASERSEGEGDGSGRGGDLLLLGAPSC
jgi:hypothetical protein